MRESDALDGFLDEFLSGNTSAAVEARIAENQAAAVQEAIDWVPPVGPELVEAPADKRLSKRTKVAAVSILVLIPLTIILGMVGGYFGFTGSKRYMTMSLFILFFSMMPFFMVFEGRKPQARELIVLAVLIAIAVAGRAAFFMLPFFKPDIAVVIIAAVCLGPEAGFMVGAMQALTANMFFGQGLWTPWQMFASGIIGFLAGVLFKKGKLKATKPKLCVFGFISAIFIYGFIMNTYVPLSIQQTTITWQTFIPYYVSGLPVDTVHAAATVFFLFVIAKPMIEKLERVKVKYGLIEMETRKKAK